MWAAIWRPSKSPKQAEWSTTACELHHTAIETHPTLMNIFPKISLPDIIVLFLAAPPLLQLFLRWKSCPLKNFFRAPSDTTSLICDLLSKTRLCYSRILKIRVVSNKRTEKVLLKVSANPLRFCPKFHLKPFFSRRENAHSITAERYHQM